MSFKDCLNEIQEAAGREFTDDELDDLFSELQRRARRKQAEGQLGDDAFTDAAEEMAADRKQMAIIEKRNAYLNLVKREEGLDFVKSQFTQDKTGKAYAKNASLGLTAWMTGVNRVASGSRFSADAQSKAMASKYLSGMQTDLDNAGLIPYVNSGRLDRDIAKEMSQIETPNGKPGITGSPQAKQIAEIFAKYNELARVDANASGAWVNKQWGYIVRQSHDMDRIRKAGFDEWRRFILERLDERTFDDVADRGKFLDSVYKGLASGVHLKNLGDSEPTGFKGPRNLAKMISQDRVLHFKDSDAWMDYQERFGIGSLNDAMISGLERMGKTTGLMQAMGPNPESNFDLMFKRLMSEAPDADAQRILSNEETQLKNKLGVVDGSVMIPANQTIANIGNGWRAWQSMSKLGAAVVSAVSDIPIAASELRYQGQGMLSSVGNQVRGVLDGITNGKDKRQAAAMLSVYNEGMVNNMLSRFDAQDNMPGKMSRALRIFFKLNGLQWWTDVQRASVVQAMGHQLALNKAAEFGGLNDDLRRTLRLFAIGEPEWNALKQATQKAADGREYIVPEAVRDLPDEAFTELLGGAKKTRARMRNLRSELEQKLRAYYVDRSYNAVLEPDARTRAFITQGQQPGTPLGEGLRLLFQFKAFPIAVIQRTLGREIYGRGDTSGSLVQALRAGNGEMRGFANLMAWTTAFGYLAMAGKDLSKGRTPRNPEDPKTWAAAALQGGALGIYGDFLFGETRNRFGGGALDTLVGPTFGQINSIADLVDRLKTGDDFAAQTFRLLLNNTPGINLFYTRWALDYLFLNSIQEALNPGFLRRFEKRLKKENDQEFIFPQQRSI